MIEAFIDAHREAYGVVPICHVLQTAPSWDYEQKARVAQAELVAARAQRNAALRPEFFASGAPIGACTAPRKVWKAFRREGRVVARCTVARVIKAMGLRGVVRGRRVCTTIADTHAERPQDLVQRNFTATRPNQWWVSDFTYVSTWRGFVYVAFVIDVFSRRIVGWRASTSLRTDLALDALEQALYDRDTEGPLVHHSDRGVQLGLNWSSQHPRLIVIAAGDQVLQRVCATRETFAVSCSRQSQRHLSL